MSWYIIGLAVILFLFYLLSGGLAPTSTLMQPLLKAGPISMDWRDIIAIAIVAIVAWALYTHQLTAKEALTILAGILGGKLLTKPGP